MRMVAQSGIPSVAESTMAKAKIVTPDAMERLTWNTRLTTVRVLASKRRSRYS